MKKILIYYNKNDLRPIGGPCGYLYNLYTGLQENSNIKSEIEICFLDEKSSVTDFKKKTRVSKNKFVALLFKAYKRFQHIKDIFAILLTKRKSPVNLNDYDAVHFHTTRELYYVRNELKNYKGKVLLTSHSPQPLSKEYIEGSSKVELFFFGWIYKKLIKMDRYAFLRADYIIFPCEEADEPYIKNWSEYSKIKEQKASSYRYLLSGTVNPTIRVDKHTIRKNNGISDDAFVICYVGRHNEIKGYSNLINICLPFIEKNPNTYVLVAGSLGPLYPPKNNNWIEVGWTNDPHSIIAASNVFILPNNETYFDLVLLEVLSIGTPLIISNTGGNRYFKTINNNGIQIYDSFEDCINKIDVIKNLSKKERGDLAELNRKLFAEKFSTRIFAQNYIKTIESILTD